MRKYVGIKTKLSDLEASYIRLTESLHISFVVLASRSVSTIEFHSISYCGFSDLRVTKPDYLTLRQPVHETSPHTIELWTMQYLIYITHTRYATLLPCVHR
jgi:hypothetical protein